MSPGPGVPSPQDRELMEMKEMDRVWFCSSLSSPRWLSPYHWDVTSGISGAAVDESELRPGQPQAVPSCAELS